MGIGASMMRCQPIRYGVKYIAPVDPFAEFVVSQLRFDASNPLRDDTGRTWSVVNGTPAISTLADTPHGPGSAMRFFGNGAIATAHDSAFNIHNQNAVVEFWLKNPAGYNDGSDSDQVVYKSGWPFSGSTFLEGSSPRGGSSSGWRFQVPGDGSMMFQPLSGSGGASSSTVDFSNWVHVAMTKVSANNQLRLFINGTIVQTNTNPSSSAIDQAISLMIGGPVRNNAYLVGYIKDFRFTVGSLRGYTSNFTPPDALSPL